MAVEDRAHGRQQVTDAERPLQHFARARRMGIPQSPVGDGATRSNIRYRHISTHARRVFLVRTDVLRPGRSQEVLLVRLVFSGQPAVRGILTTIVEIHDPGGRPARATALVSRMR
ncbi:hypothetical protein K530_51645 [Streptomyces noursei CCRC 11814]|nr:hypothetical protein K530_51645 [Streptomyces noursei CCRC 11814]